MSEAMCGLGRRAEGVLFWLAVAACSLLALFCLPLLPNGSPLLLTFFVLLLSTLVGLVSHRPGWEWRHGWAHSLFSVGAAGLGGLDSWLLLSWWAA